MPKVCIDVGHYGKYNRCPNNPNYYESEVMWKLHLLQKKYLEQLGIEVVTTRQDKNVDLELTARGRMAKGCDLFISNHSNAVGGYMNENIDSVDVYHLVNDTTTKCDDVSSEFADMIAPEIADIMGTKQGYRVLVKMAGGDRNNDGMINDNYYGVLHGSRSVGVAGVIIEHSFHTNSKTVAWLLNDNNLNMLAKVEAECIATFLYNKESTVKEDKETTTKTLYRVQCGAFKIKTNAEKRLAEVKSKGFKDAFIRPKSADGYYRVQCGAFSVKANAQKRLKEVKSKGFKDAFVKEVTV